ncbi:MAG: hypothetical protein U0166_27685 [Acidobacteriota bacterium]
MLIAALCAACFVAPSCAIINRMDGMAQAKDLAAHGEEAEARVLEIWDTGVTVNNDPVVGMLVEVHPNGGDAFQTRTKCLVPRLQVSMVQPGNAIPVRFDPADHTRVSLEYKSR